jgi:hypothetical protein
MVKDNLFKVKALNNGKVYLKGADVAKALKYKSCQAMEKDGIPTVKIEGVSGKWVLEAEYNNIMGDKSLELTAVKELKVELQNHYKMSGLIAALVGTPIDTEKVFQEALNKINKFGSPDDDYLKSIQYAIQYQELIKDTGLQIRTVTEVSKYNGTKRLRTYLCGQGIFRNVWIDKGSLDYFTWEYEDDNGVLVKGQKIFLDDNGDIRFWDDDTESDKPLNLTQSRLDDRDYAQFSIEENIMYLLDRYRSIAKCPQSTGEFMILDTGAIYIYVEDGLLLQMLCGNLDDNNQTLYINGILKGDSAHE